MKWVRLVLEYVEPTGRASGDFAKIANSRVLPNNAGKSIFVQDLKLDQNGQPVASALRLVFSIVQSTGATIEDVSVEDRGASRR